MYYETPESLVTETNEVLATSGDRWETEMDPYPYNG